MSLLLAGITALVIGDSHLASKDFLITALHDDLQKQGAEVYSFGACGTPSGAWMTTMQPPCGSAFRLKDDRVRVRATEAGRTQPLADLVAEYKPNLIIVVNGDTMAAYKEPAMPRKWIWDQVSSLTKGIKASGVSCVWVGPAWGSEGGRYGKTFARSKEMSEYLSEIVAPCIYVDSLKMSQPGEWPTMSGDGQHFTPAGYINWGSSITRAIISSDILQQIKHSPL